ARQVARVPRRVGVDDAARELARGLGGFVAIGGHGATSVARRDQSRVTRTTSSADVTPASTQRLPSSRIDVMPPRNAVARISLSGALRWINARTSSSTVNSS